jgi:hypothetical protein
MTQELRELRPVFARMMNNVFRIVNDNKVRDYSYDVSYRDLVDRIGTIEWWATWRTNHATAIAHAIGKPEIIEIVEKLMRILLSARKQWVDPTEFHQLSAHLETLLK